jgi:hypothetical protein
MKFNKPVLFIAASISIISLSVSAGPPDAESCPCSGDVLSAVGTCVDIQSYNKSKFKGAVTVDYSWYSDTSPNYHRVLWSDGTMSFYQQTWSGSLDWPIETRECTAPVSKQQGKDCNALISAVLEAHDAFQDCGG